MGSWFSKSEDIENLQNQLKTLQNQLKKAENENQRLKRLLSAHNTDYELPTSVVSRDIIEKLVDEQLEDPDKNISWMPDGMERRLKVEIMMLVANMVDHMLETTRVEFMGHEMRFDLVQPKFEKKHRD